ncbi:hypothetical protein AB9F26_19510 [Falsihalocynthiibacter sp. BN13B15]|uniref:hypothetical protein n=1 Tax=Falsihalocynthiibacter sp. BN13B15 TaxID=3240871 RepID=UPI00350FF0EE
MHNKMTGDSGKTESTCRKTYCSPILREFGSVHMTTQGSRNGMDDGAGNMSGTRGMGMLVMVNMRKGFLNTG